MGDVVKYTRKELAELLNIPIKDIHAMCSPSRKGLIPDADDHNIISMDNEKNSKYVKRKMMERNHGIPPRKFGNGQLGDRKLAKAKKAAKEAILNTELQNENSLPDIKGVPDINKHLIPHIGKEPKKQNNSDNEFLTLHSVMERAKADKMVADAKIAELNLAKARGETVLASEVAPFISTILNTMVEEMIQGGKKMGVRYAALYDLPIAYQIEFEKDIIDLINKSNEESLRKAKEHGKWV